MNKANNTLLIKIKALFFLILLTTSTVRAQLTVDILVVGAGGAGGAHKPSAGLGPGGGGGGEVVYIQGASLPVASYTVTVAQTTTGKALTSSTCGGNGSSGGASQFNNAGATIFIKANGGGGGAGCGTGPGLAGGSGGGGHNGSGGTGTSATAPTGITGTYNQYVNNGGTSTATEGGGGGGAGAASTNKNGGQGISINITGTAQIYGSGGGGNSTSAAGGAGGTNAGNGSTGTTTSRTNLDAASNFGGGGGGNNCGSSVRSGDGGSGVVIIRYAATAPLASGGVISSFLGNGSNGGSNGVTYQVHKCTASTTFTITTLFTTQPSSTAQNICINGTATALSCVISGTSPTYQWYSNTTASNTGGTIISGATNSNYTPPTTAAGTTYYYCAASSSLGSETSQVSGAININNPPVAGTISGGNSVTAGTNSTVLTIAGNTGAIQWQNSGDNTTFNDIGSATNSTYTATNLNTTTYYRVKVTSAGCSGTEYTNTNTIVVNPAPSGTTSPSITISGATLNVTNNTATAVDPALTMSFSGNLTGFTVTISENYSSGDVLSYTGSLPSGVTTSGFSTQRRSITFTGTTSAANWQTFLRTVTLQTTSATCNPETRKVSFTASTNFYNYFNGHYYEYVSAKKNWTQARDYAASKSFYGRQGYLVVITSAEENAYISQMIGYNTWMGGTDNYKLINAAVGYTKYANQSAAEGKYHWVTGPEKGVNFSNGNHSPSIPAGRYCRWQSGEPNNYNTGFYDNNVGAYGEHYMHIYADRKTWNDFPNDRYFASIIEYGDMPGDNPQGTVEGTRNISVNVPATGSVTGGGGTVCSGTNSTTLTLSGNAGGSTVARWESSPDNFLETSTSISNTSTSYTATNLIQTTFFRAVVVNNTCTTVTSPVKITVVELNAGDVIATTNQVCAGQSVKLTLSGLVGTVQKWQTTTNTSGGSFTDISNTTTSLTRTVSTAGNHYFRAVVNTAACTTSDVYSDWYTVVATVGATPTGGEVTSQAHCSVNNSGTLNLSGATGGTFTWQYSTDNGTTWTNTAITAESYNYANIAQNTLFRVQVSNGCNTAYSSNGSVTIYGTNKCQWIGGTSTDWGTKANWCNDAIAENGSDFDISPDATYNLVLDRNRTVGTINFNGAAKYIYLGNHKLIVTDILGADTANHIKTDGNGELKTSIPNNDSFTFCVGAGSYNPVTITNKTGSTDDFQVRLIDNVYDRGSTGNPLNTPRIKRTWFIDKIGGPANSGSGIDMAFDWYTPEVSGTINTYRLYHYNGNNWDKLSAGSYATRTRNLKYSGYTGTFSPFSMGDDVVLLPVNWQALSCLREEDQRNRIIWSTGSEIMSDSFVVERGNIAGQFRRIGAIPAAGNSYTPRSYSMIDEQAPVGTAFYRVRQTDILGNSSCSEICEVASASSEEGNVKIYPNPADNNLYVLFAEAEEPGTEIVVTDITGKEVLRRTVNKGRMVLPTGQLPSGVYAVQIKRGANADIMQKIIIQH